MMKLSTKGRYATRILLYLAMHEGEGPARKQAIADAESISADYVEQILIRLKSAGLVLSHRGARGGFSLARPAGDITVADILQATEGPMILVPCEDEGCSRNSVCVTREIWRDVEAAIQSVFGTRTLESLVRRARELRGSRAASYAI